MKKRILFLSIALASLSSFSFAAERPDVNKEVITSFTRQFANAKEVKWENHSNFIKAQFTVNDMVMFAYFNRTGELIAVTRFISPNQLPMELTRSIKSYEGYWVSDLFEIQTENGTAYYATIENGDQVMILKSEGISGWQLFQVAKK